PILTSGATPRSVPATTARGSIAPIGPTKSMSASRSPSMPALSRLTKLLLCLALGAGRATAAYAVEDGNDRKFDDAWEDAIGDQEPILTEKQFAMLNTLAFQAAASKVCDGFALDHDKFTAAMTEAVSPPPPDLSEDEADH